MLTPAQRKFMVRLEDARADVVFAMGDFDAEDGLYDSTSHAVSAAISALEAAIECEKVDDD